MSHIKCDQQADYGPRSGTIMRPLPCHLLPLLGEGFLPIQGGQPAILGKGDWSYPEPVWPGPFRYLSTKPGDLPVGQNGPPGAGSQGVCGEEESGQWLGTVARAPAGGLRTKLITLLT